MNENEFLSWDDAFVAEESEFTLLPAGDYPYKVTKMERKIYDGNSSKIQNGTPMVELTLSIDGGEKGTTVVSERIFMLKRFSWKLTEFFTSIGQPVVIGQPFKPNWQTVIGSKGMAKVEVNNYTNSKGEPGQNNRVKNFLKPETNNFMGQGQPAQQPTQAPNYQQNNYQQPQTNTGFNQTPPQNNNWGGAGQF